MLKPLLGTGGIKSRCTKLMVLAAGLVLSLFLPSSVFAQVCNGQITINYVSGPMFALPGDTYRVEAALGTSTITGAGEPDFLTVNRFRFELDCNANFALGIPCTNDADLVAWVNDSTITDNGNCGGVTWSTDGSGANPNEVVFTPSAPFNINENTLPSNGCVVEFDVSILDTASGDATPNQIEQVVGYSVVNTDAVCSNGLTSGANQTGAIPVCPGCDDGVECTKDACNQTTGQCEFTPTDGNCDDGVACTKDACIPGDPNADAEGCVYTATDGNCDDNDICTQDTCDPIDGCQFTPLPPETAPPECFPDHCGTDPDDGCSIILLNHKCRVRNSEGIGATIECRIRIQNQSGGNPEPAVLVEYLDASQFVYIRPGGNMSNEEGDCEPQIPPDPALLVPDQEWVYFTCSVPPLNGVNEIKNTIEAEIAGRNQTFHSTHSFRNR